MPTRHQRAFARLVKNYAVAPKARTPGDPIKTQAATRPLPTRDPDCEVVAIVKQSVDDDGCIVLTD